MAKQSGLIFIEGTINNMTFYKTREGEMMVKMKSSISKERFKKDPCFIRMHQNNNEFGHAGKAGQLLRRAVREIAIPVSDSRVAGRLLREMLKAAKEDRVNKYGSRNVIDGDLRCLEGFNFNEQAALAKIFPVRFKSTIDRLKGLLGISIASFNPAGLVKPASATHFKLISAGAEIDFSHSVYKSTNWESDHIPLNNKKTGVISINHQLSSKNSLPLFLLLGVRYFTENGSNYDPVEGADLNALSIVAVSTV